MFPMGPRGRIGSVWTAASSGSDGPDPGSGSAFSNHSLSCLICELGEVTVSYKTYSWAMARQGGRKAVHPGNTGCHGMGSAEAEAETELGVQDVCEDPHRLKEGGSQMGEEEPSTLWSLVSVATSACLPLARALGSMPGR